MLGKALINAASGNAAGEATYVEDVFSTYLYTGNSSAKIIENGIALGDSNVGGSVKFTGNQTYININDSSAFSFGSSSFCIEMFVLFDEAPSATHTPNLWYHRDASNYTYINVSSSGDVKFAFNNSATWEAETAGSLVANAGQWYHIAAVFDQTDNEMRVYIDGVLQKTTSSVTEDPAEISAPLRLSGSNTGADGLKGRLSNVRVVKGDEVYTSNFTVPTSALTAITGTSLLICQGDEPYVNNAATSLTITEQDSSATALGPFTESDYGQGGMVWIKDRTSAYANTLFDTERGATKGIRSNTTEQEYTLSTALTAFNSDGFTLGSYSNTNFSGNDIASWTFRKAPGFFDVVTWTGNGTSSRSISHSLDAKVGFAIIKRTDAADEWGCFARVDDSNYAAWYVGNLNYGGFTTARAATTTKSSSIFTNTTIEYTAANLGDANISGATYIAYLFAHNDGDGEFGESGDQDIIKCGSYTGVSTGVDVNLGWEAQWVLIKKTTNTSDWFIADMMRGMYPDGTDTRYKKLEANTSDAEEDFNGPWPTSTGFRTKGGGTTDNGDTYIYIAIRRPHKPAESGTEVFAIDRRGSSEATASGVKYYSGFPVDASFYAYTLGTQRFMHSRLTGSGRLVTSDTTAETDSGVTTYWDNNVGWWSPSASSSTNELAWMFKRSPGFFDVVCYSGNSTAGHEIKHNLGVAPEFMIQKVRNDTTSSWYIYHKDLNVDGDGLAETDTMRLYDTSAAFDYPVWNDTAPTSTSFYLGGGTFFNQTGDNYITYLFASQAGISKVGSYTGNGTSQNIDCGFSAGARFVLIKRTDSTGDWHIWDTERGIVSGNDPFLELNTTNAENTSYDSVDPASSGFIVNQDAGTNVNVSSATYIYLAIA